MAIERNPHFDGEGDRPPFARGLATVTESPAEAQARLEEIHQYLRDQYARRDIVASTVTEGGTMLDWVPIESQLGDGGSVAEPPGENQPFERLDGDRPIEPTRFELEHPNAELGPPGTIPLVRLPVEKITPEVGLNDWLAKGTHAMTVTPTGELTTRAATVHKYGSSAQSVTAYGTSGNINVWHTFVEYSSEFSLGQLALTRGSGTGRQTVEVGHQVYKDLYGDWLPHLFIFYTTNGHTQSGDYKGGYNQNVAGWVQASNTLYPGALSSPLSTFGGAQYQMALKVQLWQGNWWVQVNGVWMGYYPASLFNSAGLRSQADVVHWFGEVVDDGTDPATTRTDMGSGRWPYQGWQQCAFMNNLMYQSDTGGTMQPYRGSAWSSHPNCYTLEDHFSSGDASWGSYCWWGGSGRNSSCP
ncbi:neprosin family prolyl endopeptidase [Streptomyces sp. NPDC046727]|uniref:neprosin family prolyl endopeptidase n=1 Tax=Streptomyces sp. NPDC046727 TaxID=3155373 RepID=UPI0033E207E1